jgi:hypothetical protein
VSQWDRINACQVLTKLGEVGCDGEKQQRRGEGDVGEQQASSPRIVPNQMVTSHVSWWIGVGANLVI